MCGALDWFLIYGWDFNEVNQFFDLVVGTCLKGRIMVASQTPSYTLEHSMHPKPNHSIQP